MAKACMFSLVTALLFTTIVRAQTATAPAATGPAAPPDISNLMRDLADPDTHDKTLAAAKALPASAIVPLWDLAADTTHSARLRSDVLSALRVIYPRALAQRHGQNERDSDAWIAATGTKVFATIPANKPYEAAVTQALADMAKEPRKAIDALKGVIDAGCNDPLVRFEYVSNAYSDGRLTLEQAAALFDKIARDFQLSPYPAARKFHATIVFAFAATQLPEPAHYDLRRIEEAFRQALQLAPAYAAQPSGVGLTSDCLMKLWQTALKLSNTELESSFDRIAPTLHKSFADNAAAAHIESLFLVNWAWESRGGGYANTVTDDGWKAFGQRLDSAQEVAERGWRLDPLEDGCSTEMIEICKGKGLPRDTMETWFLRATLANPNKLNAYYCKMDYLLPKWHGSEEEVLAFARTCVKIGNGTNRIPTIMIYTHRELKAVSDDPDYMDRPLVWADIQSAYQKLLEDKTRLQSDRDAYLADRGRYVRAAIDSKRWKEAVQLMDDFGPDVDMSVFGGQALYNYARKKAVAAAGGGDQP